ncbi:hypothetical protein JCM21900_004612 [Sporobolomyces salmonicolor]
MEEEPPPPGLSTAQSSSLPSLTPSPESVLSNERPAKRPRLASTSPPPPRLSHTSWPRTIVKSDQPEDLDALLYGLDEEDLMMPPSSDPVVRGEDADVEEEDDDDPGGLAVPRRMSRKEPCPEGVQAERGRADDSGIGLLPSDDEHSGDLVKANATFLPIPEVDDAEEFEGDDLWLGFDDSDMGFDDPDTFSSLSASLAGPIRASITVDTAKGKAVEAPKEEEEDPHENEPAPALESFGFANLNSHGSFVFATRKPFAASEAALQRARAILEADDELPATATTDFGSVGSSTPLPRSVPLRPSIAPPAFIPPSRPSAANAPNSRYRSTPRFDPLLANHNPASRPIAFAPPPSAFDPSSHTGGQAPLLQQGSSSPLHIPQPLHVTAPQPFIGFLNAAGRTLDMPTEEALRRARQRFERSSSPPGPPASELLKNGSNRPLRPPSSTGLKDVFESAPHPPSGVAGTSSFALPPIAKAADARHDLPMTDGFGLRGGLFDSPTVVRTLPRGEGNEASPGKKTPLLPVENVKGSAEKEGRLSDKTSPTTFVSSSPERSSSPPPLSPIPRSTVAAPQAAPPQTAQFPNATSHPIAAFASPCPPSPHLPRPSPAGPSRPPFAALPTPRTHGFRSPLITTASALRNPSRPPASTPLRITATPSPAFPVSSTPVPLPHRLNLGMTPRNKPFHLANTQFQMSTNGKGKAKGFVTPFKGGKRPEGLTPMGLKGKPGAPAAGAGARGGMPAGASTYKSKAAAKGSEKVVARNRPKLFDLDTAAALRRFDLVNFGLRPQTHYYEYLQSLGFPDRLISMDSTSSADYVFSCGRSSQDAFLALQSLVVSRSPDEKDLVTLPWVKNHWSLVVWKLACYVRSRPDLKDGWWRFEMVLEQLRYRYEREINLAHRSAIKRIQEQDSPASLPMVLCVSQIRWDDSSEEFGETDTPLTIVGLELTDGWYRIRTNVDATLKSACERGKIVLGAKIAVMGAKLENSRGEGIDVLQALSRSSLVISGNSTSLAPWHAKLGFCRERFVAGFESLTSGGGLVPLVDIVIDKIYPCGYMDLRRGRSSETWGEEEELTREEEWRRGRERIQAKLADDAEKDGDEENELVELLQEAVLEVGPLPPSPPGFTSDSAEEPEEILDRLEGSASKASIIRKMSAPQLHACLALAVENARNSRMSGFQELQQELAEKYPPREVRSFRLIRVRDARLGDKSTGREALLTVWDAQAFEPDFFREGRRYLVTNLVPKGNWQRRHKEIALVTRRNSKWSRVQHDGAGRQAYIASQ